jgi:hypothetical protein
MLAQKHLATLAESGITPEYAVLRGYDTITDRQRLTDIHIARAARNCVPGLLIPLLGIDGTTWGYQYRPDEPRVNGNGRPVKYETPFKQGNHLDIPPGVAEKLADPNVPLWFTEGTKKADCGALQGLCIVALTGVWNWKCTNGQGGKGVALPDFHDIPFKSANDTPRRIIIAYDGDVWRNENVQKASRAFADYLTFKGAQVEYLCLPDTDQKTGLDDYLTEHTIDDLWQLVKTEPPVLLEGDSMLCAPTHQSEKVAAQPIALDKLRERFLHWFGKDYDLDSIYAVLAAAAVEQLDGDPVWLLIVSGPGAAKTETVAALKNCDGALQVSTISSVGALLSATARKERAKDATGGLLKELEPRGIMVIKDLTSILSLQPNLRGPILAALREVYDGSYIRDAGVDGGRKIPWHGRIAVVGAVTTAWDQAHTAISAMGDRFVLLRVDSNQNRLASGRRTIQNTSHENQMRDELAELAAGVIAGIDTTTAPELTEDEQEAILAAADLVTRARTAVEVDYRGGVIDAHAPEMPTRFARQLAQVLRGAVAIGLDRAEGMRLAIRCARDSMPPLRLDIIEDLAGHPHSTPTEVRRRLGKPRATVDRQLQALHILDVVSLDELEYFNSTHWHYTLIDGIDPAVLDPETVTSFITTGTYTHREECQPVETARPTDTQTLHTTTNKTGNGPPPCLCVCGRRAYS